MNQRENPRHGLIVAEGASETAVVLSAVGTIDMLTAPQLQTHVDSVLSRRPSAFIVDLSRVEFLGSAGINVLANAHNQAEDVDFGVVADGPATSRPLRLLGIDTLIPIYPTLADAVDALDTGESRTG
ncbi:STAS domain-containing protein [Mycobacterium sp.]|uniref:STAS domain-containing protein n=1 Tax=Mycobacterium sp. TaxID=1785 RepID=UPI0025CD835A|nr:STAS domain-containing protein [Mycobacterium sp.]